MTDAPQVSVIVLAFGPEPYLDDCIDAILNSTGTDGAPLRTEVLLVDNGSPEAVSAIGRSPDVRVMRPETNLGFAGGCNLGAREASAPTLVFVNSDAVVERTAIARLAGVVSDAAIGLACGSVRLADTPELINSVGNPVHFLGLAWAGGLEDPADQHAVRRNVASVSGAFFAARRDVWSDVGGFDEAYFAYHEDADLSLRIWLRGQKVVFEPTAVARHHYDFHRSREKFYLLERNRWFTILTTYPMGVLVRALPALILFDAALVVIALFQGWWRAKLRSYVSLARSARHLIDRRRSVQVRRSITDAQFASLLAVTIDSPIIGPSLVVDVLNRFLRLYWRLVWLGQSEQDNGLLS